VAQKTAPAAKTETAIAPKRIWFKSGASDAAFHTEAVAAAHALGLATEASYQLDELKSAVLSEKERCTPKFVWMLNWKNCEDPVTRRGAIAGLVLCNPDTAVAGKPLAVSAIFEPDAAARKASIELIKSRKDTEAAKTLVTTWKSSFDEGGVLADNESQRKATVAAMREVGDKRVYEALFYYAMLEIRGGSADLVRIDTVSIKGQNINLPIDLPVLELRGVEGTIIVPALISLKQATGQDFGRNIGRWRQWLNGLP
jgi:hypothetical protein